MLAHHGIYPPFGSGGREEMGKCLKNTFERPEKTCAMIDLLPSEPVVNHVSMCSSETANRHVDEIAMEKKRQKKEEEKEKKGEEKEKKEASTSETTNTAAASGATNDVGDLEATRQAVLLMGMPEALVQMVIDLRHVDPTLSFTNARELYQLVDDLACHPDRQTELTSKLSQHQQQASRNTTSNVAAGQEPGALSTTTTTTTSDQRRNQPAGMSEGSPPQPAAIVDSSSKTSSSFTEAENLPPEACSSQRDPGPEFRDPIKTPASAASKERLRRLAEENWRLNRRKRCRACRKTELADSGITFLPCGHFITCENCAEKFDDCLACGRPVMGTVKTFLS